MLEAQKTQKGGCAFPSSLICVPPQATLDPREAVIGYGQDFWMMGFGGFEAILYLHGNQQKFEECAAKNVSVFDEIRSSKGLSDREHWRSYQMESICMSVFLPFICHEIGKDELGQQAMEVGKIYSTDAFALFWEDFAQWAPMFNNTSDYLLCMMDHAAYLAYGAEGLRPELPGVEEILKSPEQLRDWSAPGFMYMMFSRCSMLELGFRVYEKLGNDDMAEQCATFQVDFYKYKGPVASGYRALGRIAKRRGDADAAAAHFRAAADNAFLGKQPFQAVLAGKELGGEAGDATIEEACAACGKSREIYVEMGLL